MAVKINKLAGTINTHCWQICYLAGLLVRVVALLQARHVLAPSHSRKHQIPVPSYPSAAVIAQLEPRRDLLLPFFIKQKEHETHV